MTFAHLLGRGWRSMGARFDGLVVLVVEDEWLVREDLAAGLRQEGWTVLEAETGAGALRVLRETETVDLLITDIRLADQVTGWEVAKAFRASHPKTPVIYASGNPDNDSHRVAESIFLSKPVVISQLLTACRKVLEGVDGSSQAGRC
jgi:two-component system OmpR family response regulator